MLFGSLVEASQNFPFKTPFSNVNCQPASTLPMAVDDGPLMKSVVPSRQIMAAATPEGGKFAKLSTKYSISNQLILSSQFIKQ